MRPTLSFAVLATGLLAHSSLAQAPATTNDYTIVCQDAGAGGYEAFPDVCRLADGRLLAVFYAGYTHVSYPNEKWHKGGRISGCTSADEGRTWSPPSVLYDGPDDDRDPSIVQVRDGRLLCNFFSLRKAGDGHEGLGSWLVASDDLGRTWSKPQLLTTNYYCSSPIRELPNGQLILGLYREAKETSAGAVIRSGDGGRTWGPVIDIDNGGHRLDAETDLIALKDGALLAAQRAPSESMCSSLSRDGGQTWSRSEPMGFPGHCPYFLRAPGDILLLAHRLPKTALHYSLDEGKTWRGPVAVDDCIGAYPSMVNLRDGSVLIVYYEEGAGSSIRARRFKATPEGITWLKLEPATATAARQGDYGAPAVKVTEKDGHWQIAGLRRQVDLDPATLQITVRSGERTWRLQPSAPGDLEVRHEGAGIGLQLSEAGSKQVALRETGYQTGVQIELGAFAKDGQTLDFRLQLSLGLEGPEEELVCEAVAMEGGTRVRQLLWPGGVEPASFDATVVPFMQGMFLPKDWPRKVWLYDDLSFGRGLYMPWWGHQQGPGALLVMLETPDDGGCRFQHPEGGPTRLAPRWVHSLGRFAYPRRVRLCFFDQGDYVALAKRYRQHAIATGRFVSLREKIARSPLVGKLLGAPVVHTSILYHIQPESSYYHKDDPAKNHELTTFDARAAELQALATNGLPPAYVHLDGWGFRGYDNLHPDVLPPAPDAGGWDGFRRLSEVCDRLGYIFAIHDQYRDYYVDAPSYQPQYTVMEENGGRQLHSTWYGGRQSILCSSLAPGHVRRNHDAILAHNVLLRGAYLDVFSVVPPDECYHPDHPVTRTECLRYRGECLDLVRAHGGVVSSEEPSDWSVPHLDLVHHGPFALSPGPGSGPAMGVPLPLFNLVYHDALFMPWSLDRGVWGIPETDLGFLHGMANAGLPYLSLHPGAEELARVKAMCALNRRVGLLEMTGHRFLDASRRRQETAYSDGTRVTIDLEANTYTVTPALEK